MNHSHGHHYGTPDPQNPSPGSTSTPPPNQDQPQRGFFDQVRGLGVRRSSNRWIAGVCSGLARRFNVDPLLVRAAMVAALLLGIGFVAYLIAWALLPDEDGTILAEKAIRDGDGWGIALLVIIALAIFGTGPWFSSNNGWAGGLVVVGGIAAGWWFLTQGKGRSRSSARPSPHSDSPTAEHPAAPSTSAGPGAPLQSQAGPQPVWATGGSTVGYEPPPVSEQPQAGDYARAAYSSAPARPKAKGAGFAGFLLVLGATVLGYGLGMLLSDPLGGPSSIISILFATAAAGLSTLIIGLLGRRSVLSSLLSILLAISLVAAWGIGNVPQGGFGKQLWAPSASSVASEYSWGMGSAVLDLREMTTPPQQSETTATVSFGEFVIFVPEDISTRIVSSAHFGSVEVIDTSADSRPQIESGTNLDSEFLFGTDDPAAADLTINANVRFGTLKIMTPVEPTNN